MLMLLFVSVSTVAQTLKIYTEEMPPYHFYDEHQQIVGINIDILKVLLEEEHIDYQIVLYPWSRAFKMALNDTRAGLISTAKVRSRVKRFKWVGPFAGSNSGFFLFRLKTRSDIKIEKFNDLKNYVTGYVRKGVYEEVLKSGGLNSGHLMGFVSSNDYFKMLFSGKIDLAIGSPAIVAKAIKDFGYPPDHLIKAYKIKDVGRNYLALNLNVPNSVVRRLNRRLLNLKKSGRLLPLIERYTSLEKVTFGEF